MPQHVLLTGANGFIAQHILAQFLEAGHSVLAVVRSESSASRLRATFRSYPPPQLDIAIVPDITAPGAFDAVLASDPPLDAVLHTASPFDFRKGNASADFLDPAVKGTTEILRGVARAAPSVKRVVVTSSTAAVVNVFQPAVSDPPKIYDERDWLEVSQQDVEEAQDPRLAYLASKVFAEKAAWAFVAEEKPSFDLVTINPPIVYGPPYDPSTLASPQDLNQSNFILYAGLLAPELTSASPVPPEVLHLYVDVRDVARAHLLAVTKPDAGGNRFVIGAGGVSNQKIANVLRERFPELRHRIPEGDPAKAALPEGIFGLDPSLAGRVLGLEYKSLEDTIVDTATPIVELERRAKKTT
ncbi:NAD dependent epimerase/dehydratase [Colletotrichum higginsianum IMI 349063]|uniref:NAD dependent epimerase/dehydratase n=2 Tax=Colletotrichum higginsianum TaxID=80884 RepID=A0A1B7Y3R6_COLHI|nr:NAD dependent epimerase/dehydratase [Colletotrichum higginsianum IMI 349063]OBR06633.1 NAD dependent epimerase/dehydratase [Colletotrichum higginsianum IMI 349063]TIC97613.1 putative uncharacterized oxidoreductase [Colletotrichum higginsianum]GJD04508.1 NAD dependent epimerase/dehydratase [Colletotrichum higginsianum]